MSDGADPAIGVEFNESPAMRALSQKLAFSDRLFLALDNPVLRRELLTALRSNKAFILQFVFLSTLCAVVYLVWPREMVSTSQELARKLFRTFGQSELVLLAILSPAFSASAMTIEKELGCMDLLMASPIRPRTILMGKYLSSVLFLFLLVLSTAPLVSVIQWLPGLGPNDIVGLFLLLLSVAACFGMIGLTCSVFFHRSQSSLALTYVLVLPLAVVLLVCAIEFDGFFLVENACWPAGAMLLATLLMYRTCHARLRRPFDPVFRAAEEEDISTQTGLVLVQDRFPDNLLAPPRHNELLPENVNPIYQKEIRSEIFGRGTLFLRLIIQVSMFLSVVFLTFLYISREHIFVYYLITFTMIVAPAFACNAFTQERERRTLDLLLTTLVQPSQIIIGKFLACLRLAVFLTGLVGIGLGFYVFVGRDEMSSRLLYFFVYLAILGVTILFEIALAMFFSLSLRSTVQSMITTYTSILLLFCAPVAAEQLLGAFAKIPREQLTYILFVSPFEAIYSVTSKAYGETERSMQTVALWPEYLCLYLVLSLVLMTLVFVWFERRSLEGSTRC